MEKSLLAVQHISSSLPRRGEIIPGVDRGESLVYSEGAVQPSNILSCSMGSMGLS